MAAVAFNQHTNTNNKKNSRCLSENRRAESGGPAFQICVAAGTVTPSSVPGLLSSVVRMPCANALAGPSNVAGVHLTDRGPRADFGVGHGSPAQIIRAGVPPARPCSPHQR